MPSFAPIRSLLSLTLGLFIAGAPAATAQPSADTAPAVARLSMRPAGVFSLDGIDFSLMHFAPGWVGTQQGRTKVEAGYPRLVDGVWETRGGITVRGVEELPALVQTLTPESAQAFRLDYLLTHPEGIPTQELALQLTLPFAPTVGRPMIIDGRPLILPMSFQKHRLLTQETVKRRTLVVPSTTGDIEISGVFSLLVQDQRAWKQEGGYTVRIQFPVADEKLVRSELSLAIRHKPWRSTPVSIRAQANRAFIDEVAGDGRGGWTDEGPENDLSALPAGQLDGAGVIFDIIDARSNGERAALVLSRSARGMVSEATVTASGGEAWRNLYLLHAGDRLPQDGQLVGRLHVRYADGSVEAHEVQAGRDVGEWKSPLSLTNALIGWAGETGAGTPVGLYVSRFTLKARPVVDVRFEAAGDSRWLVAGLSWSPDELAPFQAPMPLVIAENAEWVRYDHQVVIEPGSVFDFSGFADAPAGKHGPIKVTPSGHFEFESRPGVRARFWGVNLCFSANYLQPAEADMLAKRLVASGYNTVRLHHFDRDISAKDRPSYELDPEQLDKFDNLFATLKRHGLYVNIDLFASRRFTPEQMAKMGMESGYEIPGQFKSLIPISEAAFEDWCNFARNLLARRNPHTGLTWAEDPALIGICPVNEDPLFTWIDRTPSIRARYDEVFAGWWQDTANRAGVDGDEEAGFRRFLHERQIASDARMRAFLRSIGVNAPITGTNFQNAPSLAFVREHYDYVDNPEYWDPPHYPEKSLDVPGGFLQSSGVKSAGPAPRGLGGTRIWNKPFAVTEFNFVRPNRYRAEGGVFMPAYAALQDWDVLYNFDYSSHRESILRPINAGTFSIANDPIGLLADRVSALVFLRRDIAPAKGKIGYAVQSPDAFKGEERVFPYEFLRLGLITRIGSSTGVPAEDLKRYGMDAIVVGSGAATGGNDRVYRADGGLIRRLASSGVLPANAINKEETRFVSETGQIEVRADEGAMKVVTPRSELFVLPAGQSLDGDRVSVKNGRAFGSVSVVSVDGLPLKESSRLLVTHLTDALTTGDSFANLDRRLLVAKGRMPFLVRAGRAEISLQLAPAKTWRAWAVAASGKRLREVELVQRDGAWVLSANTADGKDTQMAYELTADASSR